MKLFPVVRYYGWQGWPSTVVRFKIYHRLLDSRTRTTTRTINTKYRFSSVQFHIPLVSRYARGTPAGGGGGSTAGASRHPRLEIELILSSMRAHEPASFWREIVVVILLRVLGKMSQLRNQVIKC